MFMCDWVMLHNAHAPSTGKCKALVKVQSHCKILIAFNMKTLAALPLTILYVHRHYVPISLY